jgi:hypothetical protein
MSTELARTSSVGEPATGKATSLPELVERAGRAARFARDVRGDDRGQAPAE